jgi:hypothetical protein
VIGVAAQAGAALNTALAALMATRLERAGFRVQSRSDGIGLRVRFDNFNVEAFGAILNAWTAAANATVDGAEPGIAVARQRLAALARHPLDSAAVVPLARCSANLGVLASATLPDLTGAEGLAELERARVTALVRQRTSLAVVSDGAASDDLVHTLEANADWRSGKAAEAQWPTGPQHAAYLSAELTPGQVRLEVALRTPTAEQAVVAVKRMSQPLSALALKLAALPAPVSLVSMHATAHPHGGCVRLELAPSAGDETALPVAAARAVGLIERELSLQAHLDVSAFEVTQVIVGSGNAAEAAARAAWWTLNSGQPAGEIAVAFSALALSAHAPDDPPTDQTVDRATAVDQRYRAAIRALPPPSNDAIAERRVAVERGQGSLWLLLASPCVLAEEGSWDSGRSAMAAVAVSAGAVSTTAGDGAISLRPFVSPDGIGVVAHAGMSRADEPAAALARRVARALGRAVAELPRDDRALSESKRGVLALLAHENARGYAAFARRAVPQRPSWLAPWGHIDNQAGVTIAELRARWQSTLRGPLRAALLANVDAEQATVAFDELDRWLLIEARSKPCARDSAVDVAGAAKAGDHALRAGTAAANKVLIGVRLPAPNLEEGASDYAALTVAALDGDGGLLARTLPHSDVSARLLGGNDARALVLEARCTSAELANCRGKLAGVLERLAKTGLTEPERTRALERAREQWFRARSEPLERLTAVWLGDQRAAPTEPDAEQWGRFLSTRLEATHHIILSDQQASAN